MYSGKSIAILGGDTLVGRILLSKLVGVVNSPCRVLLLQEARPSKTKTGVEVKPITRDPYFKLSQDKLQAQSNNRVEVYYFEYSVGSKEIEMRGQLGTVDYLFNCHLPCEPFAVGKWMEKHVLWTKYLLNYLEQHQPQCVVVTLSSIYSQEPGHVSESV